MTYIYICNINSNITITSTSQRGFNVSFYVFKGLQKAPLGRCWNSNILYIMIRIIKELFNLVYLLSILLFSIVWNCLVLFAWYEYEDQYYQHLLAGKHIGDDFTLSRCSWMSRNTEPKKKQINGTWHPNVIQIDQEKERSSRKSKKNRGILQVSPLHISHSTKKNTGTIFPDAKLRKALEGV